MCATNRNRKRNYSVILRVAASNRDYVTRMTRRVSERDQARRVAP